MGVALESCATAEAVLAAFGFDVVREERLEQLAPPLACCPLRLCHWVPVLAAVVAVVVRVEEGDVFSLALASLGPVLYFFQKGDAEVLRSVFPDVPVDVLGWVVDRCVLDQASGHVHALTYVDVVRVLLPHDVHAWAARHLVPVLKQGSELNTGDQREHLVPVLEEGALVWRQVLVSGHCRHLLHEVLNDHPDDDEDGDNYAAYDG